jgi:glucose/arabinose dehydrogenase
MCAFRRGALATVALLHLWFPSRVVHGRTFALERLATGLQQPTYVTQAPGDNNNVYFVERTSVVAGNAKGGLGKIWKFDLTTRTKSLFLDFQPGSNTVSNDSGLLTINFHPDFQTNGKFYVTTAADPQPVTNRLLEYRMVGGVPTFQKTVLQYSNNQGSFHTIDSVLFKPNAVGAERNYMYVTTGDGGPQANNAAYVNRAQDLNQIYGKVLRIDVTDGADAYPADPLKNYDIPSINSFPGAPPKLGEVIASGLRNPFRATFDRANGDTYIGDVGFNDMEEIDFIKHETQVPLSPMFDFGWPKREGTQINNDAFGFVSEANPGLIAGPKGNSIDPIITRTPATGDNSITGGYVYRGPVSELQGKYIFADYVAGKVYSMNFDRNTDPTTFNGTNFTNFQDVTALWESLILGGGDLMRISSFGEDNAGNLYLVALADNTGDPYSSIGEGVLYRVIPEPACGAAVIAVLVRLAAGDREARPEPRARRPHRGS